MEFDALSDDGSKEAESASGDDSDGAFRVVGFLVEVGGDESAVYVCGEVVRGGDGFGFAGIGEVEEGEVIENEYAEDDGELVFPRFHVEGGGGSDEVAHADEPEDSVEADGGGFEAEDAECEAEDDEEGGAF